MTILLFPNVRMVIKAEKFLAQHHVNATVRPVPTYISSECGMCLEVKEDEAEAIWEQLHNAGYSVTIRKT